MSGLEVRGPRLRLRYAEARDAPALLELGADAEVTRWFAWGPYSDISEPLAYISSLADQRRSGTRLEFLIADEHDRPLGVTGLSELSRRDRRAIVGSWLGRAHWGTGANAESKALVLALAFGPLGLWRVSALANPENRRSLRALTRLGFVEEGVLRSWNVHDGVALDCTMLRLLRSEWERTPLGEVPVEFAGEPPPAFVADRGYSQRK